MERGQTFIERLLCGTDTTKEACAHCGGVDDGEIEDGRLFTLKFESASEDQEWPSVSWHRLNTPVDRPFVRPTTGVEASAHIVSAARCSLCYASPACVYVCLYMCTEPRTWPEKTLGSFRCLGRVALNLVVFSYILTAAHLVGRCEPVNPS